MADRPSSDLPDTVIDGLASALTSRFPDRFTTDQIALIRRGINQLAAHGTMLRSVRLTNADEPDPIYRAFRAED